MIISLTLNPAVDKTLVLDELRVGALNRVSSQKITAGGKGINVANDLISLGTETVVAGFVADKNIDIIRNSVVSLETKGAKAEFVRVDGRNRTNVKIIESSGRLTEINEPGFEVSAENVNQLIEKLIKYATPDNSFVLTGSIPRGVSKAIYRQISDAMKKNGAKVYIDADGEALKYAVESIPNVIKPNEHELLEYFGDKSFSEKTLINRAKEITAKGIETVIVSRGDKGVLFVRNDSVIKCEALSVDTKSTVGAGDAMLATYVWGVDRGLSYEECIRYSVAASAYAVTLETPYFTEASEIETLINQVVIQKIE